MFIFLSKAEMVSFLTTQTNDFSYVLSLAIWVHFFPSLTVWVVQLVSAIRANITNISDIFFIDVHLEYKCDQHWLKKRLISGTL